MHSKPAVKTTWYEKLAWALCPQLARKIREIREEMAERRRWKKFGKLLMARNSYYCKLTPEEFVKSAQLLLAGCD